MHSKTIVLSAILLFAAPQALAAVPTVNANDGQVVVLLYKADPNQAPDAVVAPGWECSAPAQDANGLWGVECNPTPLGRLTLGVPSFCEDAVAIAGGTPVTFGYAKAEVSCFSSTISANCEILQWVVSGQCNAALPGAYAFPLICKAKVTGVIVGAGQLYASCANGVAG